MKHESLAPTNGHRNSSEENYRTTRNVTVVGAVVNTILAATKILVGYIGQSQALIADGLHSLSDLASDVIIIYAAKHGSRDADEEHPYGHGRIETLFTVLVGLFLIIVACGILVDSLYRMLNPDLLMQPGMAAIAAALFSVLANEALYQYTHRAAIQIDSKLLEANAWHHRSDAISSIIVLIGVGGSMMGVSYLDAVAAVGMALMIVKIGWKICLESIQELIDTGLSAQQIEQITTTITALSGVVEMHTLRTRSVGNKALVDVHIQVAPKLSVSEGHFISEQVRIALLKLTLNITDVTVHIDPEDDEVPEYSKQLPDRKVLQQILREKWADLPQIHRYIDEINLHYLDDQIHIELLLPLGQICSIQDASTLTTDIKNRILDLEYIASTNVNFYVDEATKQLTPNKI